jgi:putative FmdB family regulatory protein
MPNYIYKCNHCNIKDNVIMSISQYKSSNNLLACDECGTESMARVFGANSGIIEKNSDEIIKEARAQAKNIAKKIINGDSNLIQDVYGDVVS